VTERPRRPGPGPVRGSDADGPHGDRPAGAERFGPDAARALVEAATEATGLRTTRLAALLGVPRGTWQHYFNGITDMPKAIRRSIEAHVLLARRDRARFDALVAERREADTLARRARSRARWAAEKGVGS
jgi:hypothetical protein